MQVIKDYHRIFTEEHLLPNVYNVTARQSNHSKIINAADGTSHEVLNFASNDFYGFSTDPRITESAINAIKTFGVSTCGSQALNGRTVLHRELEQAVSDLKGLKYTHLFSNAWMAIAGLLNVFCHLAPLQKGIKTPKKLWLCSIQIATHVSSLPQ
jgi:7-keto-8-aminopelargonate synthetase-like enzyme